LACPDFLLNLVALASFMRLSLPEDCDFSISIEACGWIAWKSICQQASPGSFDFARQAVRYATDLRCASLRMTDL
jgi:hypothetical protein